MLAQTRGLASPSSRAICLSAAPIWYVQRPTGLLQAAGGVHSCSPALRARTVTAAVAMADPLHATSDRNNPSTWRLPDAHSHPQDDMQHAQHIHGIHATCVAVMGVRETDWPQVLQLQQFAPSKVIPCFGVHPWYAHLHSSEDLPQPGTAVSSNTPPHSSIMPQEPASGAPAQHGHREALKPQPSTSSTQTDATAADASAGDDLVAAFLPFLDVPSGQDMAGLQSALADSAARTPSCCGSPQHSPDNTPMRKPGKQLLGYPSRSWAFELEHLLHANPNAVVGECGFDLAAIILGSKAQPSLAHQTALVRHHLLLAAHWKRPISMHCVRATGAMQDLLRSMPLEQLPRRIMLHSFGGPPESVKQLVKLKGVGERLWFSFSTAINASKQGGREKLVERVKAVPDDRLLLETDQNTARNIDSGLETMLQLVAEAKGWSLGYTADKMICNFEAFFEGFLPSGYSR